VKTARVPSRAAAVLFEAGLGLRVRNSGYRSVLRAWNEEISVQVATNDLAAMVRAGLLEQRGKKRGTYYVAAGVLAALRIGLIKGRQPVDTSKLFEPLNAPTMPELPFEQSSPDAQDERTR
jgi:hypothetical protein